MGPLHDLKIFVFFGANLFLLLVVAHREWPILGFFPSFSLTALHFNRASLVGTQFFGGRAMGLFFPFPF